MDIPIYAGIDLHKKTSFITLLDNEGKVHAAVNIENSQKEEILFLLKQYPNVHVAVEATMNWYWMVELLEKEGIPVSLVNTIKMKMISTSHKKTDKNDSRLLAEGLKNGNLPLAYSGNQVERDLRELVRVRIRFVHLKTKAKNLTHQVVMKLNLQPPCKELFCQKGRKWLRGLDIREPYKSEILLYLEEVERYEGLIAGIEERLKKEIPDKKSLTLLKTVPGISDTLGIMILSQIGNIDRFDNPNAFCAYAGLVPTTKSSGGHAYQGRIIKASDALLRTAIGEAIMHVIPKDKTFNEFYEKVAARRGKSIARVACMHRLGKVIYHILKEKRSYVVFPLS